MHQDTTSIGLCQAQSQCDSASVKKTMSMGQPSSSYKRSHRQWALGVPNPNATEMMVTMTPVPTIMAGGAGCQGTALSLVGGRVQWRDQLPSPLGVRITGEKTLVSAHRCQELLGFLRTGVEDFGDIFCCSDGWENHLWDGLAVKTPVRKGWNKVMWTGLSNS